MARTIHERSSRSDRPFVELQCGASPSEMLDGLFGAPAGVFTGLAERRPGALTRADGGPLFLHEISLLDPVVQVYLLRLLASPPRAKRAPPDVRIVSSTDQDLPRMCREQLFRGDFLFVLSAATVQIPPLRERGGEDIELLARYFVEIFANRGHRRVPSFSDEAMRALVAHPWPGNDQELEHVAELAVILSSPGETIAPEHLPGIR